VRCRASVEAELRGIGGARHTNVDLGKQSATVIFDPTRADVDTLRAAIGRAGYTPKAESLVEG
jgi:copper chaperone CopZ